MDENIANRSEWILSVRSWCIVFSVFSLLWSVHIWLFTVKRVEIDQDGDEALLTFGPAGGSKARSDLIRPSPILIDDLSSLIKNAVDDGIRSRQVSPLAMEGADMRFSRSESMASDTSATSVTMSMEEYQQLMCPNGSRPGRPPLHKSNSNSFRREESVLEVNEEGSSDIEELLTEKNGGPSSTTLSGKKRAIECLKDTDENESPRKLLKQISWSPDDKHKIIAVNGKVTTKKVAGTKRKAKGSQKDDDEEEEFPTPKSTRKRSAK